MLLPRIPTLLSLLSIVLSSTHSVHANPYPHDGDNSLLNFFEKHLLKPRQCNNPCGWQGQVCCPSNQVCYTSAGLALCSTGTTGAATAGGSWQVFTTTYTDVTIITTTYSAYITAPVQQTFAQTSPPAPVQTAICDTNANQVPCGNICCAAGQFCAYLGQCSAYGGSNSGGVQSTNPINSGTASAFIRPTSQTVATVVSTGTFTTTIPFETAVGTGGAALTGSGAVTVSNGLSGGAIAGIVIGVLAGILLLLFILFCCCLKGAIDGLLELLGLRSRKRRVTETTIIEEHRRRTSGSGSGRRPPPRRWYGNFLGGPSTRVDNRPPPRKDSGGGGLGGLAAVTGGLAALAVLLGLRRKSAARRNEKSDYGSESSYTYDSRSYTATSPSSLSSRDDRDRRSRR